MNKLELLKLADSQDEEAYTELDFEEEKSNSEKFKEEYSNFYDDIKQPSKYIKEDW